MREKKEKLDKEKVYFMNKLPIITLCGLASEIEISNDILDLRYKRQQREEELEKHSLSNESKLRVALNKRIEEMEQETKRFREDLKEAVSLLQSANSMFRSDSELWQIWETRKDKLSKNTK